MVSTKVFLEEREFEVVVASQLLHTRGQLAAASGEDSLSCWTSSSCPGCVHAPQLQCWVVFLKQFLKHFYKKLYRLKGKRKRNSFLPVHLES